MGLFSSILEKLGFGQQTEASKPTAAPAPTASAQGALVEKPAVAAMSVVDVVGKLESLAASNPQKLNWKTSIVDLLKLLNWTAASSREKSLQLNSDVPRRRWAIQPR
jgi:Domain of unknown function (DUF3597)